MVTNFSIGAGAIVVSIRSGAYAGGLTLGEKGDAR